MTVLLFKYINLWFSHSLQAEYVEFLYSSHQHLSSTYYTHSHTLCFTACVKY